MPAHRLYREVGRCPRRVGARLAERGDRDVHQRRVHGVQIVVAKSERRGVSRLERLDEKIRGFHKPKQQHASTLVLKVQGQTALVRFESPPCEAVLGAGRIAVEGGASARRRSAGWLDLDDVGAHRSQNLAAQGTALVAEIEHAIGAEQGRRGRLRSRTHVLEIVTK